MSRFTKRGMQGGPGEADCYYCVGVVWGAGRGGHDPIEGSDGAGRWLDTTTGNSVCTPHKKRLLEQEGRT